MTVHTSAPSPRRIAPPASRVAACCFAWSQQRSHMPVPQRSCPGCIRCSHTRHCFSYGGSFSKPSHASHSPRIDWVRRSSFVWHSLIRVRVRVRVS